MKKKSYIVFADTILRMNVSVILGNAWSKCRQTFRQNRVERIVRQSIDLQVQTNTTKFILKFRTKLVETIYVFNSCSKNYHLVCNANAD